MITIRNKKNYTQYLISITLILFVGFAVIFFFSRGHPIAYFTLFLLIEFLILSQRFTSEVSITDENLQIKYYKWGVRRVLSYNRRDTTAKTTWSVLISGSKYKILKIYFHSKLVYSFNTNEGFFDEDIDSLNEALKSSE
jgi:hypothetical protein